MSVNIKPLADRVLVEPVAADLERRDHLGVPFQHREALVRVAVPHVDLLVRAIEGNDCVVHTLGEELGERPSRLLTTLLGRLLGPLLGR